MPDKMRHRIANLFGYDIAKRKKQMVLDSHLNALIPQLRIDLVIDIGANIGQYGRLLRRLGYKGEIISFEPLPDAYQQLERICNRDPLWTCHEYALSDADGTAEINVSRHSVFSSFHAPNKRGKDQYWRRMEVVGTTQVSLKRLDDELPNLVDNLDRRRILLKMDTQGHDRQVVAGGQNTLSLAIALHTELSVQGIYEETEDYIEAIARYRSSGFELTGIYPSGHDQSTGIIVELDCVMARTTISPLP